MAKSIRSAPRSSSQSRPPKPTAAEPASYWDGLNQTLAAPDEFERMLPKTVHGIRRSSLHRKI